VDLSPEASPDAARGDLDQKAQWGGPRPCLYPNTETTRLGVDAANSSDDVRQETS